MNQTLEPYDESNQPHFSISQIWPQHNGRVNGRRRLCVMTWIQINFLKLGRGRRGGSSHLPPLHPPTLWSVGRRKEPEESQHAWLLWLTGQRAGGVFPLSPETGHAATCFPLMDSWVEKGQVCVCVSVCQMTTITALAFGGTGRGEATLSGFLCWIY